MSSTQFWTGLLVPPIIKRLNPILKKFFKLSEFDPQTRAKITSKKYPPYYALFYILWGISLMSTGIFALILMMIYAPTILPGKNYAVSVFLGLINMIGTTFILGALINSLFWRISPENFRNFVMLRQLQAGWGYDINQQIKTLLKIGLVYYLIASPLIIFLLLI